MDKQRICGLIGILMGISVYLSLTNYYELLAYSKEVGQVSVGEAQSIEISHERMQGVTADRQRQIEEEIIKSPYTFIKDRGIGKQIGDYQIEEWLAIEKVDIIEDTLHSTSNGCGEIEVLVDTLVQRQEEGKEQRDRMKLAFRYDVVYDASGTYKLIPEREFDWSTELKENTSWIKRMPYYQQVPQELETKIQKEVTRWIEERETKWCSPEAYVYLSPYKENMLEIQVQTCEVYSDVKGTKNEPIFNVVVNTRVLRKDYKTVYYTYIYQIGMIEEEIVWIKFLNAHEIDK